MSFTPHSHMTAIFEAQHREPGHEPRSKSRYEIHHQHLHDDTMMSAQYLTPETHQHGEAVTRGKETGACLERSRCVVIAPETALVEPVTLGMRIRMAVGSMLIHAGQRLTSHATS